MNQSHSAFLTLYFIYRSAQLTWPLPLALLREKVGTLPFENPLARTTKLDRSQGQGRGVASKLTATVSLFLALDESPKI